MNTALKRCRSESCSEVFEPKNGKQEFCDRKCYIKWYHKNNKISKYPNFCCPECGEKTKLDFHPKNSKKWRKFKCPKCGHSNDSLIEQEEETEKTLMMML